MKRTLAAVAALALAIACSNGESSNAKVHPYGEVKPIPKGCLYMAFFAPSDESHCKRSIFGHIKYVITPIDRTEPLLRQYTPTEFAALVAQPPSRESQESRYVPGPKAWQEIEQVLVPSDQVWSFGYLDSGFAVIRKNKLLCMVVTCHSL